MPRFQCFNFLKKVNKGQLKWSMSTMETGQIFLYCCFNKIIKGPGTSFQLLALSQNHVRNVSRTAH